jgi:hypothetical protein
MLRLKSVSGTTEESPFMKESTMFMAQKLFNKTKNYILVESVELLDQVE